MNLDDYKSELSSVGKQIGALRRKSNKKQTRAEKAEQSRKLQCLIAKRTRIRQQIKNIEDASSFVGIVIEDDGQVHHTKKMNTKKEALIARNRIAKILIKEGRLDQNSNQRPVATSEMEKRGEFK